MQTVSLYVQLSIYVEVGGSDRPGRSLYFLFRFGKNYDTFDAN